MVIVADAPLSRSRAVDTSSNDLDPGRFLYASEMRGRGSEDVDIDEEVEEI